MIPLDPASRAGRCCRTLAGCGESATPRRSICRGCSSRPCWPASPARGRTIGFPRAHLREPRRASSTPRRRTRGAAARRVQEPRAACAARRARAAPDVSDRRPVTASSKQVSGRFGAGRLRADQSRRRVAEQAVAACALWRGGRASARHPRPAVARALGAGRGARSPRRRGRVARRRRVRRRRRSAICSGSRAARA